MLLLAYAVSGVDAVVLYLVHSCGLSIFGCDEFSEVFSAVDEAIGLFVVVQIERHFTVVAFEAVFMVDLGTSFLSLLSIHRLGADLTLLSLGGHERHDDD